MRRGLVCASCWNRLYIEMQIWRRGRRETQRRGREWGRCGGIEQVVRSAESLPEGLPDYMVVIDRSVNQLCTKATILNLGNTLESPGKLKNPVPRPTTHQGQHNLQAQRGVGPAWSGASVGTPLRGRRHNRQLCAT